MKHETMLTHGKRIYAPEAQDDENFCKKRKTSGFSFLLERAKTSTFLLDL